MISFRKLAALDMTLNNKWIIFAEFHVGVFGIAALAYLLDVHFLIKLWLYGAAVNYIPLAVYATEFVSTDGHKEIGNEVLAAGELRKYNIQQFLMAIPFFAAVVSLYQKFAST